MHPDFESIVILGFIDLCALFMFVKKIQPFKSYLFLRVIAYTKSMGMAQILSSDSFDPMNPERSLEIVIWPSITLHSRMTLVSYPAEKKEY